RPAHLVHAVLDVPPAPVGLEDVVEEMRDTAPFQRRADVVRTVANELEVEHYSEPLRTAAARARRARRSASSRPTARGYEPSSLTFEVCGPSASSASATVASSRCPSMSMKK